jgi:hypothetical protein
VGVVVEGGLASAIGGGDLFDQTTRAVSVCCGAAVNGLGEDAASGVEGAGLDAAIRIVDLSGIAVLVVVAVGGYDDIDFNDAA